MDLCRSLAGGTTTLTQRRGPLHAPCPHPRLLWRVFASRGLLATRRSPAMPPDAPCATLRMPDGREIQLPVLTDAAGATFVDVRKLQPETGARARAFAVVPCVGSRATTVWGATQRCLTP